MGSDVDYQEVLDDVEIELDGPLLNDLPRGRFTTGPGRDHRRAIEELREEKRLRALLADYDLEDDL
jgi:hypothetical protein